jgi:acetyltransferase-like isoleucine patch superfamily enzyme
MQRKTKDFIKTILCHIPIIKHIFRTRETSDPITVKIWFCQKILGFNRKAYWPVHFASIVNGNVKVGIGTAPGMVPGCYIQGAGGVEIGDYSIIAPGVGIISSNHDIYDYKEYVLSKVKIGRYCWIGMNAVILPNVELGDHTIVGAGSVVTKSFPEGYCILAGVPAKIIKTIDKDKVVEKRDKYEYYGYIPKSKFEKKTNKK